MVYLNPVHITALLIEWVEEIESLEGQKLSNSNILKLVVHTSFAFERVIKKNPLNYTDEITDNLNAYFEKVDQTLENVEKRIDLNLSKDEKLFIAEIVKDIY